MRMAPASGKPRTSQPYVFNLRSACARSDRRSVSNQFGCSSLKFPQLVHVDRQLAPEQRDDEAEADRHLKGGHDHHDQREDLPAHVPVHAREGHEREVRGVQHQLEAEQDDQRVAAREHAARAGGEDERGDDEVPGEVHFCGGPPASSSVPTSVSPWVRCVPRIMSPTEISCGSASPARRRARMTAPTAATSSSSEAISKATRYVVRNWRPTSAGSPYGREYGAPSVSSPFRPEPISAIVSSTNSASANTTESARSPGPLRPASPGSMPPT